MSIMWWVIRLSSACHRQLYHLLPSILQTMLIGVPTDADFVSRLAELCVFEGVVQCMSRYGSGLLNCDHKPSENGLLANSIIIIITGKSCMEEFDERQAKQSSKKSKGVAQDPGPSSGAMAPDVADSWTDRFQIYFPTEDTVTGSRGGPSVSQEPTAKTIGLDARSHDDPGLGSVTEAEIVG